MRTVFLVLATVLLIGLIWFVGQARRQAPWREMARDVWFVGIAIIVAVLMLAAFAGAAFAHDLWINHGGYKNPAGEWCCGDGDCALIDGSAVHANPSGYVVDGFGTLSFSDPSRRERIKLNMSVPYSDAQPSPDGAYWVCLRADKSRRCFFAPPPGS